MATKTTKRLLTATGGLLVFTASVFATYAVFKFTDFPSQLIADLNTTVVEADDKKLIENVEANQKALEAKYATRAEIQTQNAQLANQLDTERQELEKQKELLKKEQNYVQQKVASEEMTSKVDQKSAAAQLKNVEMVEPAITKLQIDVEDLNGTLKALLNTHEEGDNLYRDLELKFYNFQKGLGQKSNFKEFLLLIFGLKIVWGLFTGYARTFYPYKERTELMEALEAQKEWLPQLNQKLEENKKLFVSGVETVTSVLKRVEDSLNFDYKIQSNFVTNVGVPLQNAIGRFQLAFEEYLRAQEISAAHFESFMNAYWYLPYVKAELQKPEETYYFYETINRFKEQQMLAEARENLRNATMHLNNALTSTSESIKKLQNEFLDKEKLAAQAEEKA